MPRGNSGNRRNSPRSRGNARAGQQTVYQYRRRDSRGTTTSSQTAPQPRVNVETAKQAYLATINNAQYIADIVTAFNTLKQALNNDQIKQLDLDLFVKTFSKIELLYKSNKFSQSNDGTRKGNVRDTSYDIKDIAKTLFVDFLPIEPTKSSQEHKTVMALLNKLAQIPLQIPDDAKPHLARLINISDNFDSQNLTLTNDILTAAKSGLDVKELVTAFIKKCKSRPKGFEYKFSKKQLAELLEACLIHDTNQAKDKARIPISDINYLITAFGNTYKEEMKPAKQKGKGKKGKSWVDITSSVMTTQGQTTDAQQLLPAMHYYAKLYGSSDQLNQHTKGILENSNLRAYLSNTIKFNTDNDETAPQSNLLAYLRKHFANYDNIKISGETKTDAGYYADILISYTDKEGKQHTVDVEYDGLEFHHYKTTRFSYHQRRNRLTDRLPKNHTRDAVLKLHDIDVHRFTIADVKFNETGALEESSSRFDAFCKVLELSLAKTVHTDADADTATTAGVANTSDMNDSSESDDSEEVTRTSSDTGSDIETPTSPEPQKIGGVTLPAYLRIDQSDLDNPIQFGTVGTLNDVLKKHGHFQVPKTKGSYAATPYVGKKASEKQKDMPANPYQSPIKGPRSSD